MPTAVQQLLDLLNRGHPHYFMWFYLYVTSIWVLNFIAAGLYALKRPYRQPFAVTASGIVPVANEKPDDFRYTLHTIFHEGIDETGAFAGPVTDVPDELVVVINGGAHPELEAVCRDFGFVEAYPGMTVEKYVEAQRQVSRMRAHGEEITPELVRLTTRQPGRYFFVTMEAAGKRGALMVGDALLQLPVEANPDGTPTNIRVLYDSDVLQAPNALEELKKPFRNRKVGGVSTYQRVFRPVKTLARFADWMEESRGEVSMPAMSMMFGYVGCLPGRMIALRGDLIPGLRRRFIHDYFFGSRAMFSDDRWWTIVIQKMGFRTVIQKTSKVWTDAPTGLRKFIAQQIRWGRGSQGYTLKNLMFYALGIGSYERSRSLWQVLSFPKRWYLLLRFSSDIIIPFWWLGTIVNLVWKVALGDPNRYMLASAWLQAGLVTMGVLASAMLRNIIHLRRKPRDFLFLPLYVLLLSFLLTPVRICSFFIIAWPQKWGTRKVKYVRSPQFVFKALIPPTLGVVMLYTASAVGPLIETRQRFLEFMDGSWYWFALAGVLAVFVIGVIPEWRSLRRYIKLTYPNMTRAERRMAIARAQREQMNLGI